jgi:hypothetical protein
VESAMSGPGPVSIEILSDTEVTAECSMRER